MAQHEIRLKFNKELEVLNSDVRVEAKRDGTLLGTLTLSKGSIDWRPSGRHRGKGGEIQLSWAAFAEVMAKALEEKNARKRGPRKKSLVIPSSA
jgi:hypothetical protein